MAEITFEKELAIELNVAKLVRKHNFISLDFT
jgi:hypothetical protein